MTEQTPARTQRAARAKTVGGVRRFGTPERAELLRQLEVGKTISEVAGELGFSRSTIATHTRRDPAFRKAVDAALEIGDRHRDRSTAFTADVRAQVVERVGMGRSVRQACVEIGASYGTARDYIAQHEDFRVELAGARVLAVDRVESAAWDGATGKLPNVNARLIEYLLNNKRPTKFRTARLIGVGGVGENGQPEGPLEVDDKGARTQRLGDMVLAHGADAAALAGALVRAFPTLGEEPDSGA